MSDLRGCKIHNFKKFERNTLQGIFDLELPLGLILRGCTFHRKGDSQWLSWPGKPYEKQDGTKSWSNIVDFVDNKSKYLLEDEVLPLVLAVMAESGR